MLLQARARARWRSRLPPVDGKDVGDAAKMVEKSISDALKGMPPYKDCIDDLRAQKYDEARRTRASASRRTQLGAVAHLPAAGAGRPQGVAGFDHGDARTRFSRSIRRACSRWSNLVDAYKAKGDKDKAIEINLRI